jgi:Glycosyl hydrolases family 43.
LTHWEGPFPAFRPPEGFWADRDYWAPEVREYEGSYYMFASFKADGVARATQILRSDHPRGPFVPHGEGPITPAGWECLDGTLYVEKEGGGSSDAAGRGVGSGKGRPWIVFCREWLEVRDGQMWAMPLSPDLQSAAGEPILLFSASEAPWVRPARETDEFVTDGPFLYREDEGRLFMLWSSVGERGYGEGAFRERHDRGSLETG